MISISYLTFLRLFCTYKSPHVAAKMVVLFRHCFWAKFLEVVCMCFGFFLSSAFSESNSNVSYCEFGIQ